MRWATRGGCHLDRAATIVVFADNVITT